MQICIGIISYLPDKEEVRQVRIARLESLLAQCQQFYKLPILIVAQNWREGEISLTEQCHPFYYDKLGITGARKKLRQLFLQSTYDYIIMVDDDIELFNSADSAKYYLSSIQNNPNCIFEYKNYLLNMFGISRELFEKYEFDDIDPERGEGFEDWIFVEKVKKDPSYRKILTLNLIAKERKELVEDPYSTWITPETDKKALTALSEKLIGKVHHAAPVRDFFC